MIDLNSSLLADVATPLVTRRTRIRDLIDRLLYTTIGAQREALIEQLRHEVDEIRKLSESRLTGGSSLGIAV
jgi:hypothetical protein